MPRSYMLNPTKNIISTSTAQQYFSDMRSYFLTKFGKTPDALSEHMWEKFRRMMCNNTREKICREQIIPMFNSHEKASEDDRNSVSLCCLWSGSIDLAEFFCFFLSMIYNDSRGSESWFNSYMLFFHISIKSESVRSLSLIQSTNIMLWFAS